MPKNENIKPLKPKMDISFDIKPKTNYKNNLDSIKIELLNYPTIEQLNQYIPDFMNATWNKLPHDSTNAGDNDAAKYIIAAIKGEALPTMLETIRLDFLFDGIDLTTVTHILRYRNMSFSADCSADKMWHEKDCLVPSAIQNSDEIYEKYKKAVELCKEVYCDIINSKQISIMDARGILPRNLDTYYFVSMSLKDAIWFINQRTDKQIQPEVDNIMAYQMYLQLVNAYPFLKGILNMKQPAMRYVKQANTTGATNLYWPDEDSDIFEWNPESFVYKCTRDKLNGTNEGATNHFNELKEEYFEKLGV